MVRTRSVGFVFALAVIVAACGSSAPTQTPPPPTAAPTPTPDPHLSAPASVDRVYSELRKAGLEIIANTAEAGKEPVKTLNLTYEAWPLLLEEFTTADQIPVYTRFDPKKKPAFGQPPGGFPVRRCTIRSSMTRSKKIRRRSVTRGRRTTPAALRRA